MKRLLKLLAFAGALAGCSTFKNEFVDADGTRYSSTLVVAPFSTLNGGDAAMSYKWNQTDGAIGVGASVAEIDNKTGQVDFGKALINAAVTAIVTGAVSGNPALGVGAGAVSGVASALHPAAPSPTPTR